MSEQLPTIQPEPVSDIIEVVVLLRTSGTSGAIGWPQVFVESVNSGSPEAQARTSLGNNSQGYAEYALVRVPIPRSMLKPMHQAPRGDAQ